MNGNTQNYGGYNNSNLGKKIKREYYCNEFELHNPMRHNGNRAVGNLYVNKSAYSLTLITDRCCDFACASDCKAFIIFNPCHVSI